jgi:putative hydrolase of the HAD superfamily
MIKAVLFDLDQTLLDRNSSLAAFLRGQWERFMPRLGNAEFGSWSSRFMALDKQGMVHKSEVYPRLLTEFDGDPGLNRTLLADYSSRSCQHAVGFPGMQSTITTLRGHGLKLGIITNGETDFQSRNMAALGLDELFDAVLISQREGLRKPERQLFLRAAEKLDVRVVDCLFVGDNPVADILGAHAAGMQTAWFGPGLEWPANLAPLPGARIESLPQVLELAGIAERQLR